MFRENSKTGVDYDDDDAVEKSLWPTIPRVPWYSLVRIASLPTSNRYVLIITWYQSEQTVYTCVAMLLFQT